jgi:hypothetical protein
MKVRRLSDDLRDGREAVIEVKDGITMFSFQPSQSTEGLADRAHGRSHANHGVSSSGNLKTR